MTRPRKPMNLHLPEGTYRSDRHGPRAADPLATDERPKRPRGLSGDARKFWDDVCEELIEKGIAKHIDGAALRLMADLWGKLQTVSKAADADPTDTNARRAVTTYAAEFSKMAARFGLTPADRQRLQSIGPDPETRQAEIERQYFGGIGGS